MGSHMRLEWDLRVSYLDAQLSKGEDNPTNLNRLWHISPTKTLSVEPFFASLPVVSRTPLC